MIDWTAATACATALLAEPERVWLAVDDAEAAAPRFRNKEFPVSPLPLLVRHADAAAAAARLERYVELLGKVVALFREHAEVRRWYGLGPAAEALVAADTRLGDRPWVCRIDGYLEHGTERLVVLENNADAPAGTLFTARVDALVTAVLDRVGAPRPEPSPLTYVDELALLDVVLAAGRAAGVDDVRSVAVLQPAGRSNVESVEMVAALIAKGIDAFLADPREIAVSAGRATFGGRPADACWNKVNTVAWERMVADDPDLAARWTAALADGALVNVNPFGARYVGESKLTLGLVQDPAFADLLTAEERALVADLLPWARRVSPGAVAPDGARPLVDELLDHPGDYVLKEPYDIRGDGVTIGRAVPYPEWVAAVARASAAGHLAMRYVAPTPYPVLQRGGPPVVSMATSLDTYVLAGEARGFGAKASLAARVNVFQGGRKLAVLVTRDDAEEER